MRLKGLVALITGATGTIGRELVCQFLHEGAHVIATGRSLEKLKLLPEHENLHTALLDGATLDSFIMEIEEIRSRFPKIDILVNNAGSSGPKQPIFRVPTTKQELEALVETETVQDALDSLLGYPWAVTRALLPSLEPGASIINVSTIFSKTNYFGRAAYVTPKAALNALSHIMAEELGREPTCIRVNTVLPGPVDSDRIHTVFVAMDRLKGQEEGATEREFASKMLLAGDHFVNKEDIVNTIVFLASKESRQFTGHEFEVARGLQTPQHDTIELTSWPNPRIVDLDGHFTWIIGGYEKEATLQLAQKHYDNNAKVLLTFRSREVMKQAQELLKNEINFEVKYFDPSNSEDWRLITKKFKESMLFPTEVYVFPHHVPKDYGDSVSEIPLETIQDFLALELLDLITSAKGLSQLASASFGKRPTIVFVSNASDEAGNKFEKIRSGAISELIRIWREEESCASAIWQLIRFTNREPDNVEFMVNTALSISGGITRVPHINIAICPETSKTPFGFTYNQQYHKMLKNLDGTVTILTGGSEGIGRETTRILVQGGSFVAIASRNLDKLAKTKKFLVKELAANGFPNADERIYTTQVDVSDAASLKAMFEDVLAKHGRLDFLINNAGISGEEKLVVDMCVDGFRATLQANLLSNYDLILRALPYMKRQKSGHIINVSSAYGGMKYAWPPYPMRADYAVTKAGQRALSESFAHILGPEVKINTVAPGPVEGDRLRGSDSKPGLYHRRALLNAENGRINTLYNMCIERWREGEDVAAFLNKVGENSLDKELFPKSKEACSANTHLLTTTMAEQLVTRLKSGNYLAQDFAFTNFQIPPEPFWSFEDINQAASRIVTRAIKSLALQDMPSEYDVGREIVFNLSGQCMTGETLYPSCGVNFEQLQPAGDIVYGQLPDNVLQGKTVLIIGNAMPEEMALLAKAFTAAHAKVRLSADEAVRPDVIVSFPMSTLPEGAANWETLPSIEACKKLVDEHINNHFIAAKKAIQIDNCHLLLVTHPAHSPMAEAFASFLNTSLASLTVTVGQEASRLAHKAQVFQINADKSLDAALYQKKLVSAALLLSAPTQYNSMSGNVLTLR